MDDVERARKVLADEQSAVLAGLVEAAAAQRDEVERAAARQRQWRAQVSELLERGKAAGVPVTRMAEALGVSRQWTTHLIATSDSARAAAACADPARDLVEEVFRRAGKQP